MNLPRFFLWCTLAVAIASGAETAGREETLVLFENRKIKMIVPPGFLYGAALDETGITHMRMEHAAAKVSFDVRFLPDRDGRFASGRARRDLMVEMFNEYVESSKEKAMQFEELGPRTGAVTYCVFTDAKLIGQTSLPPGEYLHLTTGVKTWPGVVAVFRCFSDHTRSPEYQAVLKLLREDLQEVPVPLR